MSDSAPVVKLVNAVLLSALKKHAQVITIRRDETRAYLDDSDLRHEGGVSVVELTCDGVTHEEMFPPRALHAQIVRRLAVMANLPMHGKNEVACGWIHLVIEDTRHAYFSICVGGHGDAMAAQLEFVAPEDVPPYVQ